MTLNIINKENKAMKALRKHYVAPEMVEIPVNGDVVMSSPSKHTSMLKSNAVTPSVCDYEESNGVEDAESPFSSTGLH